MPTVRHPNAKTVSLELLRVEVPLGGGVIAGCSKVLPSNGGDSLGSADAKNVVIGRLSPLRCRSETKETKGEGSVFSVIRQSLGSNAPQTVPFSSEEARSLACGENGVTYSEAGSILRVLGSVSSTDSLRKRPTSTAGLSERLGSKTTISEVRVLAPPKMEEGDAKMRGGGRLTVRDAPVKDKRFPITTGGMPILLSRIGSSKRPFARGIRLRGSVSRRLIAMSSSHVIIEVSRILSER